MGSIEYAQLYTAYFKLHITIFIKYHKLKMNINFANAQWINQPQHFTIDREAITITTEPNTDFWQRTYYGFQNDNAPAILLTSDHNFSFTTKVSFNYQARFDQAGVIIYMDRGNWFKASVEYENTDMSRLGSVVTNQGYSDWATTDISTINSIWYRLSRRGADFLIEHSFNGEDFKQMRIFHLFALGDTEANAKLTPQEIFTQSIHFGIYACSPLDSSFTATFEYLSLTDSLWMSHS
jgi:regulation of enolase protein 1 (concanavalin A-like superfamily)